MTQLRQPRLRYAPQDDERDPFAPELARPDFEGMQGEVSRMRGEAQAAPDEWKPEAVPEEWSPNAGDVIAAIGYGLAGKGYTPAGRDQNFAERQAIAGRNAAGAQNAQQNRITYERWLRSQDETERHNKAVEARPIGGRFAGDEDPGSQASADERAAARAAGLDVDDSMSQAQIWRYRAQMGQAAQQERSNEA